MKVRAYNRETEGRRRAALAVLHDDPFYMEALKDLGRIKRCSRCGITQHVSAFNRKRGRLDGFDPECRDCQRLHRTPDKRNGRQKSLRWKYGLTETEYDQLAERQGGKCAICLKEPSGGGKKNRLFVDHCHTSNVIRGLLCLRCNAAIGLLGEEPTTILRALEYVSQGPQDAA